MTYNKEENPMNEKLTNMLNSITESRTQKYNAEIERQKKTIEDALFEFLEGRKAAMDDMTRATRTQQNENFIWFEYALDAPVLPEVAKYLKEEFAIDVDERDNRKVFAQYKA